MRFCKGVRNILSVIFVLNGLLYIPIILYLPSLAFSEGKFEFIDLERFLVQI